MISQSSVLKIKKSIPDIVERARLGDQNALALLVEIEQNKNKNPRSAYSFKVAQDYIKKHPNQESGLANRK